MNWALAFLYALAGMGIMFVLIAYSLSVVLRDPMQRLMVFRKLCGWYPETFERALQDEGVMNPRDTLPDGYEGDFAPLELATCKHCLLPWPLHEGRFGQHPRFDERLSREDCPGSRTSDFLDDEDFE